MTKQLRQAFETLTLDGMPFAIETCQKNGLKHYSNRPKSLKEIFLAAREHGDLPYMIYQNESWSFTDTLERAAKLAQFLVSENVQPGDRVAIAMRNTPEWMTSFIAITAIGGIAVALNSWGSAAELAYGISDSAAKVIIADEDRLKRIRETGNTDLTVLCRSEETTPHCVNWSVIQQQTQEEFPDQSPPDEHAPALIMYTSGTTGAPKGAVSSHHAVISGLMNVEMSGAVVAMQYPEILEKMMNSSQQSGSLMTVPLFHVSGLHASMLPALRRGSKVALMYKWDAHEALNLIEKHNLQSISGAPMVVEQLLNAANQNSISLEQLVSVATGGQAQPADLTRRIKEQVPNGMLGAGYGMTEANSTICSMAGELYLNKPSSCGLPLPIVEIELRDDDNDVVNSPLLSNGMRGEVFVRGAMLMSEYWQRPEESAEAIVEGWYATGDIGLIDEDGLLHIVDRKKDMVIRAGENIYCTEVELALASHPDIAECCAFGLPHEAWGEQLVMVAVAKDDRQLDEQHLCQHIANQLAAFKVPSQLFLQQQPLPRNSLNKVLKPVLKSEYSQKTSAIS
ncbi:acyl-CoA synthetase (AMP-forming)/AMP-acid ligase II [Sinobacterium caligoides]|uniref:Acyl-CoA synthetase (AMP-forming)/AMP-acid ligase II n=1 Tax=Sinobacterium caligoides TaxID=933926 RepID=A0A3N2DXR7_9GAMM|nr:class I adenylate-forming enzyme family protein [Sinobacterium caligoides]ROS04660.1 acyl-CoA synthetase (AMP-forming)/AMP-acid ligase II [Sinobacterium caligoides]